MDKLTAAYIAGLMDGEGCLYVERFATKNSPIGFQYRIIATLTMCDKHNMEFIARVTNKNIRVRKLKPGHKQAYTIDWRNTIAYEFIKSILPYLVGKKEQAQWCLYFNETLAPGRGHTYTPDHAIQCEAVRAKLKALKR